MPMRNHKTTHRNETPLRKKTPDGDVTVIDINDVEFHVREGERGQLYNHRLVHSKAQPPNVK